MNRLIPLLRYIIPSALFVGFMLYIYFGHPEIAVWTKPQLARAHLHGPRLELLKDQPLPVLIHLGAAVSVVALTVFQLTAAKGVWLHRVLGYVWLGLMSTVAISSIFIRELNHGHFSFIHLFTLLTLITVPQIVYFARTHRVDSHKRAVYGLVIGGLVIAGAFTFMPGRLMWNLFFG